MHRSRSVVGGLSRGVRKAMELLLEAHEAADEQQMDTWQYALEMNDLRRAGALDHELRMLIGLRWIEHAVEVTGEQEARRFRPAKGLALHDRSCAVVSTRGILEAAASGVRDGPMFAVDASAVAGRGSGSLTPVWDKVRRQLRLGRHIAKRFRQPAPSQEAVLDAFQAQGWPIRIEDPLPSDAQTEVKQHLNQTLKNLNRGQRPPAVRFEGDGTGRGIYWNLRLEATPRRAPSETSVARALRDKNRSGAHSANAEAGQIHTAV